MPFTLVCIQVKRALFATLIANNMHDSAHVRLTLTRGEKVRMQYFCAQYVLMEMYSLFNMSIISIVDFQELNMPCLKCQCEVFFVGK